MFEKKYIYMYKSYKLHIWTLKQELRVGKTIHNQFHNWLDKINYRLLWRIITVLNTVCVRKKTLKDSHEGLEEWRVSVMLRGEKTLLWPGVNPQRGELERERNIITGSTRFVSETQRRSAAIIGLLEPCGWQRAVQHRALLAHCGGFPQLHHESVTYCKYWTDALKKKMSFNRYTFLLKTGKQQDEGRPVWWHGLCDWCLIFYI